jgi:hypothetical protein
LWTRCTVFTWVTRSASRARIEFAARFVCKDQASVYKSPANDGFVNQTQNFLGREAGNLCHIGLLIAWD